MASPRSKIKDLFTPKRPQKQQKLINRLQEASWFLRSEFPVITHGESQRDNCNYVREGILREFRSWMAQTGCKLQVIRLTTEPARTEFLRMETITEAKL